MTDKPDTTSMTGAEFRRHVGADPAKWAEAFWQAFDRDGDRADHAGTVAFLARWLRDYGEAAVAHAQASHQKILAERLVPRHDD